MCLRILLVDDRQLVRAGFAAILESRHDLTVVGEASNGQEALELATRLQPDLALVDVAMPGPNGIELTRCLKEDLPELKVLVLTMYEDSTTLRSAMQAGASGYLVKSASRAELFDAVDAVARGELYIHPSMLRTLLAATTAPEKGRGTIRDLTPRQIEILRLIAQGYTNTQMAERLFLSVRTIEYHRHNLMTALGLDNRVDLVQFSVEHGLLSDAL